MSTSRILILRGPLGRERKRIPQQSLPSYKTQSKARCVSKEIFKCSSDAGRKRREKIVKGKQNENDPRVFLTNPNKK